MATTPSRFAASTASAVDSYPRGDRILGPAHRIDVVEHGDGASERGVLGRRGARCLRHVGDKATGGHAAAHHLGISTLRGPSWNGAGPGGQGMSIWVSSVTRARCRASAPWAAKLGRRNLATEYIHAGSFAEIRLQRKGRVGDRVNLAGARAPPFEPARGLAPGPQQRSRTFAICPLGGALRRADMDLDWSRLALLRAPPKSWFQGPLPLAEVQEAAPLVGVRGGKARPWPRSPDRPEGAGSRWPGFPPAQETAKPNARGRSVRRLFPGQGRRQC